MPKKQGKCILQQRLAKLVTDNVTKFCQEHKENSYMHYTEVYLSTPHGRFWQYLIKSQKFL